MNPLVQDAVIEYYTKNVYGIEKMYVKDEEVAGCITALTGKKTIEARDMKNLTVLFGITWEEVLDHRA